MRITSEHLLLGALARHGAVCDRRHPRMYRVMRTRLIAFTLIVFVLAYLIGYRRPAGLPGTKPRTAALAGVPLAKSVDDLPR